MSASETKIRAVIVDDESLSRMLLREYLDRHADIEVVAECANGFEAVQAVNDLAPDLLFLDIQMPRLNGFEVLELIGDEVETIFVTAYDEFALKAFEVHAIDYLLKPFSQERFVEALGRARARLARPDPGRNRSVLADRSAQSGTAADRILIRSGPNVHVVRPDQIDYVKAQDDYVAFVVGGRELLKQQTMAELEKHLDGSRFVRIHRSHILNIDRLATLELYAKDSYVAILKDGTRLAVSRSGYARLNALI
jgi:two-component system LytT family response regulator